MKRGVLFVISAPSGAGKTTLLKDVFRKLPALCFSISCTTRPPRPNEKHGVDYSFCTVEEFKNMMELHQLAEWQEVHGNFYGTPIQPVHEATTSGKHMVLDIDVYGKIQFDVVFPDNVGILVLPPSLAELERRLRNRGTETNDTIQLRVKNARKEMDYAAKQGHYQYTIVNDEYDRALAELLAVIQKESAR